MKKQKLGLSKLNLAKSRIAKLNTQKAKGGWNTASTNPFCLATGIYDDCEVTGNCNTANHCGGTNNCGTNNCGSNNCNPTQTQQIISCYEAC